MNLNPEDLVALEISKNDLEVFNSALLLRDVKAQECQVGELKRQNKLLKHQNELLEVIAMDACQNFEARSKGKNPEYNVLLCASLREKFSEQVKKNQNNS